jgi:hypothetical protein
MWAGVWIDGRFAPAIRHFEAIATATALPHSAAPQPTAAPPTEPRPQPTGVQSASARKESAATLVFARSSGFCEVMATGCLLRSDALAARTALPTEVADPSMLFAVCTACADTVNQLDPQIAARLGYRVTGGRCAATVPFFWRQTHRVMMDAEGGLRSADNGTDIDVIAT